MLRRSLQIFSIFVLLLSSKRVFGQKDARDFRFGLSGQTTVTLSEQSIIEVMINGKGPFRLIFDTGASVNILNPEVIAQLNLRSSNLVGELTGTSGGQVQSKAFHADEISIGDLVLSSQDFFNVPMPLPQSFGIVGAIGYELFSRVVAKADYEHRQLTLFDPTSFSYSGSGQKLDLQPDPRALIAQARFGKTVGNFVLDTGALGQVGISFQGWFVRQNRLERKFVRQYHGVFSKGADGDAPSSTIERIRPVCLGPACIPHLVGELSDANEHSPYAGRIGIEILRRFTTTIDWQHHALYVERSSQWNQPLVYDQIGLLTDFAESGSSLVVKEVLPHSPASRAHLKAGDLILLVDNHPPAPSLLADDPAFLQPAGTRVTLTVQRGSASLQMQLVLKDIL